MKLKTTLFITFWMTIIFCLNVMAQGLENTGTQYVVLTTKMESQEEIEAVEIDEDADIDLNIVRKQELAPQSESSQSEAVECELGVKYEVVNLRLNKNENYRCKYNLKVSPPHCNQNNNESGCSVDRTLTHPSFFPSSFTCPDSFDGKTLLSEKNYPEGACKASEQ